MELRDATALVTGAADRIGRALALNLAANGCHVAVHYRQSAAAATRTAADVRAHGVRGEAIRADLAVAEECATLWATTCDVMGASPSVIVNNASHFTRGTLADVTAAEFDDAMAVNVRAPLLLAQAMAAEFAEATQSSTDAASVGAIVNINDRRRVYRSRVAYAVTNAALSGLTRTLAVSLAPTVRVNEVRLGVVLPLADVPLADVAEGAASRTLGPAGRFGTRDEVCSAVLTLIANDYVNGASLAVDGGLGALDG